jgi:hypothetical protein
MKKTLVFVMLIPKIENKPKKAKRNKGLTLSNTPLSEAAVWSLPLGGREGVKANSLCHV